MFISKQGVLLARTPVHRGGTRGLSGHHLVSHPIWPASVLDLVLLNPQPTEAGQEQSRSRHCIVTSSNCYSPSPDMDHQV